MATIRARRGNPQQVPLQSTKLEESLDRKDQPVAGTPRIGDTEANFTFVLSAG
jgi:hypothetical protein